MCEGCAAGVQGFALGASLIVAIGAQNVFVLRQALLKRHVLPVVLFCAFADAALATLGAVGLGAAVRGSETALRVIAFGGAGTLREALTTVAAVTLLNPHVYLDTVVLVGGISASYPPPLQAWFIVGVVTASFVWFFTLGYGGRALAPLFRNPAAWRVFDIGVAAVMWLIAARLTVLGVSPQAF
jgi:L-lysine exporter family protein LysE/ArgO